MNQRQGLTNDEMAGRIIKMVSSMSGAIDELMAENAALKQTVEALNKEAETPKAEE